MKRGHALLALALAAAPAPARAQTIDRSNGEAGAPILQLTTTPRAAALGGALAAAAGVTSIFANPAGAVTVQHFEAQLAGQTLFEGSKAGSMALGVRRHAVGLALGIRYLDLGSVDEVVCNGCGGRGTPTGQRLSANEQAFALAGAVELGRASVGAALNYYATTLAEASGGAASFSAGVRGRLSSKLVLGASLQYLGGQVDVGGFGAPLPERCAPAPSCAPWDPGTSACISSWPRTTPRSAGRRAGWAAASRPEWRTPRPSCSPSPGSAISRAPAATSTSGP